MSVQNAPAPQDLRRLIVYIDLRSPYSYVAKGPLRELAAAHGIALEWRPYAIDIEAAYGAAGARDERALRKVKYIYRDARRLAARQGLTLKGPERIYDARLAHLGLLLAKRSGAADRYIDAVYDGFFNRTLDIEDAHALASVIEAAGGDGVRLASFAAGEAAAELARCYAEAEALGVFGVPTIMYGGEIYWGSDRIPLIHEAIAAAVGATASAAERSKRPGGAHE